MDWPPEDMHRATRHQHKPAAPWCVQLCHSVLPRIISMVQPGEADLNRLDASIKRNTALTKKLRAISDDTCQSICSDILKTNQSKV